jgi:hypothetical protein
MDNKEIAMLLARETFKPHKEHSIGYAIQLFVEKTVLPDEIDAYNVEEIEKYILKFLETR